MTSFSLYDTILVYVFQRATGAGAAVFPPGTARPERGVLSRNDPISMCERMRKNMNLKRSISLMILAGVLAASLASCAVSSDDPESTKGSSENPQYTYTNDGGNTPVTPTVDPEDVVYTPVNETVYVISENASFRLVSDTSQTAKFGLITEMTRTGYSSSWSKVQYEGAEYWKEFVNIVELPSSMESAESGCVHVCVVGRTLHVENGERVYRIYNTEGRVVYAGNASMVPLAPGVYVVCTKGCTQKVMVR